MPDKQIQKISLQDLVKRTDQQIATTSKLLSVSQHHKIMAFALEQPRFLFLS